MTPRQCKMARAAKGLGVRELGKLAGVSFTTINRFETTGKANATTLNKIQDAFALGGIIFLPNGANIEGGEGVRLKGENDG